MRRGAPLSIARLGAVVTSVEPAGLILSAIPTILILITSWIGYSVAAGDLPTTRTGAA